MFDLDTSIRIVGQVLIAFCVEDLPDWWHLHGHLLYVTSLIVPVFMRFQLSWLHSSICQTFPTTMEIFIYCISSSWRFWSIYIVSGDDHTSYSIMPIHGHYTLMYLGLLYLFAVMCRVVSLYSVDWMVGSSTGFFTTPLLGWTYNVFQPSYYPSDLTH